MKTWKNPILCLPAVCFATALGCSAPKIVEKSIAERPVPVQLVAVQQEKIDRTTTQPATVHAFYETEIRAKVSGFVTELAADIGDVVEADALLAKLSVPEMEKQIEVLRARVDLLKAKEQMAASGIELSEAAVRSAAAQLEQAASELDSSKASLAAAEAEYSRTNDLVSRGSLQQRVLDEVTKKRDSALAATMAISSAAQSAEAEVSVAKAGKGAAEAEFRAAQAETNMARRELEEAEVMLQYTAVTSPMSGIVTERHVEFGELVDGDAPGAEMLFVVSQTDKVRVRIPVPEINAPFVQPGDQIELSFPSFKDEPPMIATVSRRAGSLDPSTRTMVVEAEIDNADGKLLPGMFGEAKIQLSQDTVATVLPSRAVRFDEAGRSYVYVVDDNNQVKVVDVQTGYDTGSRIEIAAGLEPGQQVVGPHLKRLFDGQEVQPLR